MHCCRSCNPKQQADGSWYTGFDHNGGVSDGNQKWLGPMMWVDIAAANYRKYTGSTEFDAMAKKNLDYALKTQGSNGALEIGQGQGTEENSDAYAALMAFGYTTQAAKVATFLNSQWNSSQKRFNAGAGDTTLYLDTQTWSNQALGSAGPADAPKALDYVMANLRTTKSNTSNTFTVDGFDFNGDKDDIWLEGTAQMASAFYTVGRAHRRRLFRRSGREVPEQQRRHPLLGARRHHRRRMEHDHRRRSVVVRLVHHRRVQDQPVQDVNCLAEPSRALPFGNQRACTRQC